MSTREKGGHDCNLLNDLPLIQLASMLAVDRGLPPNVLRLLRVPLTSHLVVGEFLLEPAKDRIHI
jgi:hypothetical protein